MSTPALYAPSIRWVATIAASSIPESRLPIDQYLTEARQTDDPAERKEAYAKWQTTTMALSVPHILGGIYIVETVFSYPGIGTLSYESAKYADYNMLMILCMMTGITVIFCNIIGGIINEQIDPRVKANEINELSEVTQA